MTTCPVCGSPWLGTLSCPECERRAQAQSVRHAATPETLKCTYCSREISDTATECPHCGYGTAYGIAIEERATPIVVPTYIPAKRPSSTALKRYQDLYRAARLLVGLGTTVKTIGVVIAIIVFVFWFILAVALSAQARNSPIGLDPSTQSAAQAVTFFICVAIGVIFGTLIGGLFFLLGVLISAQGQLLMAHADSAVHTSPFLSDEERAAAMSLPYTVPATAAAVG